MQSTWKLLLSMGATNKLYFKKRKFFVKKAYENAASFIIKDHNTSMWSFQYKILNNVLFLNKNHHIFGIKSSPLCSFYNLYDETPFHNFHKCKRIKSSWSDLVQYFQNSLMLPTLTPQVVIFEIFDSASNDYIFKNNNAFINHLLFIFKWCVYKSRVMQLKYK